MRADPRLAALLSLLESSRSEALAALDRDLDLRPGPLAVRWRLVDELPVDEKHRSAEDGDSGRPGPAPVGRFFRAGATRIDADGVTVVLPARRYLSRPGRARAVVFHEAAHAALGSSLGRPERYQALPVWFREGLALHFSGEGEGRLDARIACTVLDGAGADSFLCGLTGTAGLGSQAGPEEGYLAVRELARRLGKVGWRRFVGAVARGGDFGVLMERALGAPLPAQRRGFLAEAARCVRLRLPSVAEEDFRRVLGLYRGGDLQSAGVGLESLLEGKRAPALAATSSYFLARCRYAEGRAAEAARLLEGLLDAPLEVLWEPEVLLLLGDCRSRRGEVSEAASLWEEAAERFAGDVLVRDEARRRLRG